VHDAVIPHRSIPVPEPDSTMPTTFTRTAGLLSLAVSVLAIALDRSFDRGAMAGVEPGIGAVAAWFVCAAPALTVGAFALMQIVPGGRGIAPIPSAPTYDAWPLAFVGLITVPSAAARAAVPATAFVAAPMFLAASLVALVACLVTRAMQIRRM
jgi:hypothetical protein